MNVTWLLSGNDSVNNLVLRSEIELHEDKYYIIKPFGDLPNVGGPVISLVPLDMCVRILKSNLYPGAYCNLKNLKCSAYYPFFQDYLLNNRFIMLPLANVPSMKDDIFLSWLGGYEEDVFIRPDSGFKNFTGCVVKRQGFEDSIKALCLHAESASDICLIAPPVNLLREWRFVIGKRKIIACSQYRNFRESPSGIPIPEREVVAGAPDEVKKFVETVLSAVDWQPDEVYTMDIGETIDKTLHIVEINCFSAAGLYACDMSKVVSEVRQIVIDDFDNYMAP